MNNHTLKPCLFPVNLHVQWMMALYVVDGFIVTPLFRNMMRVSRVPNHLPVDVYQHLSWPACMLHHDYSSRAAMQHQRRCRHCSLCLGPTGPFSKPSPPSPQPSPDSQLHTTTPIFQVLVGTTVSGYLCDAIVFDSRASFFGHVFTSVMTIGLAGAYTFRILDVDYEAKGMFGAYASFFSM